MLDAGATEGSQAKQSPAIILLVEDETLTRLMLADELQSHGHDVVEAADADQALAILRANEAITLLFTDIKMPGTIDGLELARTARAHFPKLKIIIASAHVGLVDWASEAHAPFPKPYDIERLIELINELVAPAQDEQIPSTSGGITEEEHL